MSFGQLHPGTLPAKFLARCLLVIASAFLVAAPLPSAADPLGRENQDGTLLLLQPAPGSPSRLEILSFFGDLAPM